MHAVEVMLCWQAQALTAHMHTSVSPAQAAVHPECRLNISRHPLLHGLKGFHLDLSQMHSTQ